MATICLPNNLYTTVDDEDYDYLKQWRWKANKTSRNTLYVARNISKDGKMSSCICMHRAIMNITDPKIIIDHKDGNGLNNQKSNLRIATLSQNNANRLPKKNGTSKYLGVCICKDGIWQAHIRKDNKQYFLGRFVSEKKAASAYNEAAIKLHGEFARLNII